MTAPTREELRKALERFHCTHVWGSDPTVCPSRVAGAALDIADALARQLENARQIGEDNFQRSQVLERENAALREDRERLDWLDAQDTDAIGAGSELKWQVEGFSSGWVEADDLRAAIDAARRAAP